MHVWASNQLKWSLHDTQGSILNKLQWIKGKQKKQTTTSPTVKQILPTSLS